MSLMIYIYVYKNKKQFYIIDNVLLIDNVFPEYIEMFIMEWYNER